MSLQLTESYMVLTNKDGQEIQVKESLAQNYLKNGWSLKKEEVKKKDSK